MLQRAGPCFSPQVPLRRLVRFDLLVPAGRCPSGLHPVLSRPSVSSAPRVCPHASTRWSHRETPVRPPPCPPPPLVPSAPSAPWVARALRDQPIGDARASPIG